MNERMKILLSVVLFLAGLVILGWTYLPDNNKDEYPRLHATESVQLPFSVISLLSTENIKFTEDIMFLREMVESSQTDILAVFLLHANVCSGYINEAAEYAELIHERGSRRPRITSLILILDGDTVAAERLVKVAGLRFVTGYGYSQYLARLLGSDENVDRLQPQMVFIDLRREELFFKGLLLNGAPGTSYKEALLSEVASHWTPAGLPNHKPTRKQGGAK